MSYEFAAASPSRSATRTVLVCVLSVLLLGGCAVQRQVDRGRAALDRDDPVAARYYLKDAVQMDPSLKRSRSFARDYDRARVGAAVVEGREALEDGQPRTALDAFESAVRISPDDAAARRGLAEARDQVAGDRFAAALRKADVGDLDASRGALQEALRLDPDHAAAQEALDSLDQPEAAQPPAYREAVAAAEAGRWDAAVSGLSLVVAERPRFLPARAALPRVLDDAADATADRAEAALAAGELDAAEAAFERVGRYRSDHPAVDDGLARVHLARAQQLEQDDRPGAALLAYREVLERRPSADAAEAVARLRNTVRDRYALAVDLQPADGADDDTQALVRRTRSELQRRAAPGLRVAGNADAAPDAQAVTLAVNTLDPGQPTVTTERQQQPYDVAFQVPNPDIERLESRASRLQSLIFDLQRRSYYYRPTVTYGIGYGVGTGYGYGHRRGYGYRGFGGFNFGNDRFRGYGRLGFGGSYGYGYRGGYGYGRGLGLGVTYTNTYRYNDDYRELRQARDAYEDTLDALDRAPDYVTQTRTEFHPFVLKRHQRTGRIEAAATVADGPRLTVTEGHTATDTSVPEPRPELGLEADPETLASDDEMKGILLDEAAATLAQRLSRTLIQERVAELRLGATEATDPAAATESRVAAAVLMQGIDPQVSDQLLDAAD